MILLIDLEYPLERFSRFDSIDIYCSEAPQIIQTASEEGFNLRILPIGSDINNATGFGVASALYLCQDNAVVEQRLSLDR